MSTFHESSRTSSRPRSPNRTRWLVIAAVLIAIAVGIVLILLYTGGGGDSTGGGGGY